MGIFDRTSVVHGDEGCRDGHYRVKDKLLEMVVSEDGTEQKLDPNAPIALQAQNPPELGDVRVASASEEAAGIPAIWNTVLYSIGDMGVMVFRVLFPNQVIRADDLGRAMVDLVHQQNRRVAKPHFREPRHQCDDRVT